MYIPLMKRIKEEAPKLGVVADLPDDFNIKTHNFIRIMDGVGDVKVMWDRTKKDEVEAARTMFNSLRKKGYIAYSVKDKVAGNSGKGELVTKFDPDIERLIMSPPMAGG
jgi:DNA polymerase IIIc chi subunit